MIRIVEMKAPHVPQVAALEKLCFSDPWSEESISGELNNRYSFWLVAEDDGVVLGYIGSQISFPEADVMNVAVYPDSRRRGIAAILVEALVRHLRSMDCTSLTLEVRASNAPAIALYEKMGFALVGRRPNYYRHPKEDALIMRKEWEV
ncbi:MAG: ribosomal protein S18-alanine N-acetyltransferase [Oscillospiraceae bacterium]|nr:ribosomal protein S18-alanine N-acetyltransferase [Oscillospiraceae bacterium]